VLDQCQAQLFTAIARHTVLVMAALAICAVTAHPAPPHRHLGTRTGPAGPALNLDPSILEHRVE
jgi:hypothetical protein